MWKGPCVESSPSRLLSCREPGTRDENLCLPWVSVMRWSMFPAGGWRDVTRSEGVWCQDLNCDFLQLPCSIGGGLLWVSQSAPESTGAHVPYNCRHLYVTSTFPLECFKAVYISYISYNIACYVSWHSYCLYKMIKEVKYIQYRSYFFKKKVIILG